MEMSKRTAEVLIFQGSDYAQFQELLAAVERAGNTTGPRRVSDSSDAVAAAADAYDAFVAEAAERAVTVRLEAVGRRRFRELVAAHPPREGNVYDQSRGYNIETFGDDLVPASLSPGQFGSEEERDEFLDNLSAADWSRVYNQALALSEDMGPDPKARLSSLLDGTLSAT